MHDIEKALDQETQNLSRCPAPLLTAQIVESFCLEPQVLLRRMCHIFTRVRKIDSACRSHSRTHIHTHSSECCAALVTSLRVFAIRPLHVVITREYTSTHTHTQETPKSKVTQGILGLRAGLFPVSPLDMNHSACSSCEEGEPDSSPPLLPIVTADIVEYRGGECAKNAVGWTLESRLASVSRAQLRPNEVLLSICTTRVCILHTTLNAKPSTCARAKGPHSNAPLPSCIVAPFCVGSCSPVQSPYTDSVQGFSIL